MPITEEQRQSRRNCIGSSDIAALLGVDPFKTPLQVYKSKVEEVEEKTSKSISLGNHLESGIIAYAAEKLKVDPQHIEVNKTFTHPDAPLEANADAVFLRHYFRKWHETPFIVEVKTSGFSGPPPENASWGKAGTSEVPPRIYFQVQHQLACSGYENALIPYLSGHDGRGCRLYRVPRDPRAIETVIKTAILFWSKYVEPRNPPAEDQRFIL